MKKSRVLYAFIVLATSGFVIPSFAQTENVADGSNNAQMVNYSNAVKMISGGVGDDEEVDLSQVQNQYNLKLMFTEGNGMYLSDVQVHISDRNGQGIADTVTRGPILLLKLPPGKYKVSAVSEGVSREQNVSVNNALRTYQLRYPTLDTEE